MEEGRGGAGRAGGRLSAVRAAGFWDVCSRTALFSPQGSEPFGPSRPP